MLVDNLKIINEFIFYQEYEISKVLLPFKKYLYVNTPEVNSKLKLATRKINKIEKNFLPLLDKMKGNNSDKAKAVLHALFQGEVSMSFASLALDKIYHIALSEIEGLSIT